MYAWLNDPGNLTATFGDFLEYIEQMRLQYLEHYSEYLTGG